MARFPDSPDQQINYQILIKGKLDDSWAEWLGDFEMDYINQDGLMVTMISGNFADQAALRGALVQLWDLNLTVLQVKKVNSEKEINPFCEE